jgi:hypothetical protein
MLASRKMSTKLLGWEHTSRDDEHGLSEAIPILTKLGVHGLVSASCCENNSPKVEPRAGATNFPVH